MAGFKGHLTFGMITAVTYCGTLLLLSHAPILTIKAAFIATSFASILPDIDSNSGLAIQIVFALLAVLSMFTVFDTMYFGNIISLNGLLIALGAGVTVLTIAQGAFKKVTNHRGAFHSIPMALIFGLLTVNILSNLAMSTLSQIIISFGVTLGYLSHLLLDELNSLAVKSTLKLKPKKSFGTALKLTSCSSFATACMYTSLSYLISSNKPLLLFALKQIVR